MALRASSTARTPSLAPPPPLSPPPKTALIPSKINTLSRSHRLTLANSLSLPATAILPLFAAPHEAKAQIVPRDQIVSTFTQVESTINQIQELGSNFFSTADQVIGPVTNAVKLCLDAVLPILKGAGEQAVKISSPVVSEASKKAQEAIQSAGIDTQPVITAAKTVADAAQQTTKLIDEAKPIAASTVETISSAEPAVILGTGGALFIAYLILPPVFSVISFSLRGYQVGSCVAHLRSGSTHQPVLTLLMVDIALKTTWLILGPHSWVDQNITELSGCLFCNNMTDKHYTQQPDVLDYRATYSSATSPPPWLARLTFRMS
ncbi:calcium sensing receptor chloroplastic [Phtheirospermum japonicum]|uniref:Calcium sensing receptor chloroplastic n=1 Tax=Phtheirospermum japonicum TaxID=374723 RepID=A0A830BGN7_9LAMI|nr:calcium sensing receptor chloroplastic [Phtheirospermum japonicum]